MPTPALTLKQVATLITNRTPVAADRYDVYMRLCTRCEGYCPVKPMFTQLRIYRRVLLSVADYIPFEAWFLDADPATINPLSPDDLIGVGFSPGDAADILLGTTDPRLRAAA